MLIFEKKKKKGAHVMYFFILNDIVNFVYSFIPKKYI